MKTKKLILFDLDNTLICHRNRIQHLISGSKNFDIYHKETINSLPLPAVDLYVEEMRKGRTVYVLSGKNQRYLDIVNSWFLKHDLPLPHKSFMRGDKDFRKSLIFKSEVVFNEIGTENIDYLVDDDKNIIKGLGGFIIVKDANRINKKGGSRK